MIDYVVTWLLAYPLAGVAVLAGLAAGLGVMLLPKMHELTQHGHPRT